MCRSFRNAPGGVEVSAALEIVATQRSGRISSPAAAVTRPASPTPWSARLDIVNEAVLNQGWCRRKAETNVRVGAVLPGNGTLPL